MQQEEKQTQNKKLSEWGCTCCLLEEKTAGRNPFDVKSVEELRLKISKLQEAWGYGCPNSEAALYAEVSEPALSKYLKRHPQVNLLRKRLQEKPILKARKAASDKVGESYSNAIDFLSRKRKNEFSLRQEVSGPEGKPVEISLSDRASELLSKYDEPVSTAGKSMAEGSEGDTGTGAEGVGHTDTKAQT